MSKEIINKIKKIEKVVSIEEQDNVLEITCDEDIRPQLSKIIFENNLFVTRMNIKDSSLEEIYLKYFKEE